MHVPGQPPSISIERHASSTPYQRLLGSSRPEPKVRKSHWKMQCLRHDKASFVWLRQISCRSTGIARSTYGVANAILYEKGKSLNGILFPSERTRQPELGVVVMRHGLYSCIHVEQRDKYRSVDTSIAPHSNLFGCRTC